MDRPILNLAYNYQQICEYLKMAQKAHPDVMTLESLAKTEEGRDIWGVTLCKGGNPEDKPAFYVQGGVHAQETMGITCSLNFLWTVLEKNPEILDAQTVYIIPCTNPDGSNMSVTTGVEVRSKLEKIPGLPNAVVPQDLNGDGKILFMRWEDPNGYYVQLPECGDVLVHRRSGDKGPFYSMITEGVVENYNGGKPRQGMRNLDFNRQYGSGWADNLNGGDFPGNHVEPRTVMKFMSSHPNIYMIMDVHCGTRALIYATPSNLADARIFRKLAKMFKDITGELPVPRCDYGRPDGHPATDLKGFIDDYTYEALGVPTVTVELGNGYNSLGMSTPDIFNADMYERELIAEIVKMHAAKGRTVAAPWEKVNHPQLGEIEVGGMDRNCYFMDLDEMFDLIPKVADYFLETSKLVPVLDFTSVTCDAMGGDIYRIRAGIINNGVLSTRLLYGSSGYHAVKEKIRFSVAGAQEILSAETNPEVHSLEPLDCATAEWFVRAKPGDEITVKAAHPKAVNAVTTLITP